MLRAVTLYQPYAQLIAWSAKRVETRSWKTNHRGLLAIHAGADQRYVQNADVMQGRILDAFTDHRTNPLHVPFGAVVAVARVIDCVPAEDLEWRLGHEYSDEYLPTVMAREQAMGDLGPGRFGWILDQVKPLRKPVPVSGRQMLWTLPEDVELAVLRQIVGCE